MIMGWLKKILIALVIFIVFILLIAMLSDDGGSDKPSVTTPPKTNGQTNGDGGTTTPPPTTLPPAPANCDIVFTSDLHQVAIGEQGSELYCMDSNGGNIKRITNNNYYEHHADVSPTRNEIVTTTLFTEGNVEHELDTNAEIVIWNFEGEMVKRLTNNARSENVPQWSPDGNKVTFHGGNSIGDLSIYVINRDGTNEQKLTDGGVDVDPSFSPTGEIVFSRGNKIMIMNDDGSNLRVLADLEIHPEDPIFADSNTIVFEAKVGGIYHIYSINKDGTNLQQLTDNNYHEAMPKPVGNKLVFWGHGDRPAGTNIWIMNKDGSGLKSIMEQVTNSQMPTGNQ